MSSQGPAGPLPASPLSLLWPRARLASLIGRAGAAGTGVLLQQKAGQKSSPRSGPKVEPPPRFPEAPRAESARARRHPGGAGQRPTIKPALQVFAVIQLRGASRLCSLSLLSVLRTPHAAVPSGSRGDLCCSQNFKLGVGRVVFWSNELIPATNSWKPALMGWSWGQTTGSFLEPRGWGEGLCLSKHPPPPALSPFSPSARPRGREDPATGGADGRGLRPPELLPGDTLTPCGVGAGGTSMPGSCGDTLTPPLRAQLPSAEPTPPLGQGEPSCAQSFPPGCGHLPGPQRGRALPPWRLRSSPTCDDAFPPPAPADQ